MSELIGSTFALVWGLLLSVWSIITQVATWLAGVGTILHTDFPRLEGLLVGILFAYFYHHRDKNPWIRTLASPLKIIIDIIDIVWDETLEMLVDLAGDVKEKFAVPVNWIKGTARKAWTSVIGLLRGIKEKLQKRKESGEE